MNRETFSLSQKELQRVAVISACIKGEVACARAAELLCLSVRQIKRLKKRLREDGEAALAHASRGRPSPRRLPVRMRDRILHLARTRYVGFNDHHLCEKLREVEGCSLGRETLRRLLRQNGLGSPKKRRAPTHRQRRLCRAREGEMLLLDGSLHRWLEEHEYDSVRQMCGSMSRRSVPDPTAFERGNYMRVLSSYAFRSGHLGH